mmetsp:Transcript_30676/g.49639  ORF Transcript_30676/g.49639 Transcript_30676/m.49639 type:complete len:100 (+) Transcript_30676:229-528(+)
MESLFRPTVDVSFRPCGVAFHDMAKLLLDIQMESFEDSMHLDEEIVEVFTSSCPSPTSPMRAAVHPVAKTITMFEASFSEMLQQQRPSSPNIFRPISVC